MIYPHEPHYVISGFNPPHPDHKMGGWGFSIGLRAEIAQKMISAEMNETAIERLGEIAKGIHDHVMYEYERDHYRMFMVDDEPTWLLHFCSVAGNACDIGHSLSYDQIMKLEPDEMIEFHPHNVDSLKQATTLLMIWLRWFDAAFAVVN